MVNIQSYCRRFGLSPQAKPCPSIFKTKQRYHEFTRPKVLTALVLFCSRARQWKLTDFGFTTEATSKADRRTPYGFGTPKYRAPELLQDEAVYTNKVDIWALGCILHELATSRLPFSSNWDVWGRYKNHEIVPDISVSWSTDFLHHHICVNIQGLLHRDLSSVLGRQSSKQFLRSIAR